MTSDVKRSLTIAGHRTSISLEAPFWSALQEIAAREGSSLAGLVGRIDAGRDPAAGSLSSAIRIFILQTIKGDTMVTRISTGSPFEATFGYSRAVRDGDTVHVSGTTGFDYATMAMPEGAGAQAANALKTIGKALEDAGASIRDVVRVRYYLTDAADVDAVVAAVGPVFTDIRPAATMVVVGLIDPKMKVEIEVTARIGASAS